MRNACVHYVFILHDSAFMSRLRPYVSLFLSLRLQFSSDRRTGVRKTKPARGMHARARTHAGEAVRARACTYMRGARLAQGPRHSPETRGPFECKGLRKARDALPTDKRYVRRARRWKGLYDSRRNELRDIPRLGTRGRTIFRSRSISRCESDESRTIRDARAADIRFVLDQAEREHGALRILAVCDCIARFSKERVYMCLRCNALANNYVYNLDKTLETSFGKITGRLFFLSLIALIEQ